MYQGPHEVYRRHSVALSAIEAQVLDICTRAAEEGRPLEPTEIIMEQIGANGVATVPGVLKRLEAKGLITRNVYQRGRQVCIVATGECTAPPNDTSPHWRLRDRSNDPPAPAIQQLRQRDMSLAMQIEQEARRSGKSMAEFLADLVYIGWHAYQAERDNGPA